MLKSIEKISGIGVYQSYSKPAGMQDFGIKNLIYGWNYSGKTTLSRIFAQIEARSANPDLSDCAFSIATDSGLINEKNFTGCDLPVRVFNSDFVRSNLQFDGGSFNPILLLGKESGEAQRKIDELSKRVRRAGETQRKLGRASEDLRSQIAQAKSETAKFIRQHLKIDPYTATHLGQDIATVSALGSQLIAEKELADVIELALTPDTKKPGTVEELNSTPSIQDIYTEALSVLAATPSFSNTIRHLEDNPAIERWVESGLALHSGRGECEFCGNGLPPHRLEAFRAHFSKDLADHKKLVEALLHRVKAASFSISLPKVAELNAQFRDAYTMALKALLPAIEAFNKAVGRLAEEVQRKSEDSRKAMAPAALDEGLEKRLKEALAATNLVIKQNNEMSLNFVKARSDAQRRARHHYVQQFVDSQATEGLEQRRTRIGSRSSRLEAYVARLNAEITTLQSQISQAQKGRERINERLASMLGGEAVQIRVVKDASNQDRFQLVRKTGAVAKNLSDGERTAVAFSYFLTKLQEISPEDFQKTIVYIDDPISSLDANHIFQVTAAIRALFFKQDDKNEPWRTTCKQLFISTHNFEFFNLLREIKPNSESKGARLYLLRRVAEKSSMLENMPASLARYQSEYHFLFDVISRFHSATDKTSHEVLMLLPNAMRRFIELYTYSRLPGPKDSDSVDVRAEILFGVERAKRILKIFHYFSHGNTLERLAGNNELIFDLEHAAKDLIEAIAESDRPHLDALVAATQP